jgi:hypothetical protein
MRRAILLSVFMLCGVTSYGKNIYCPQTIVCKNQNCEPGAPANPVFSGFNFASTPVPDGQYQFSSAWGSKVAKGAACAYRNENGNTIAVLKTLSILTADMKSSFWQLNGEFCGPNESKPYLSNSMNCPYLTPLK